MPNPVAQGEVRIRRALWPNDAAAVRQVREAVFVREQGVPAVLEWDGKDAGALHLLAEGPGSQPLATARLLPDGQIGRMAVLARWRGQGIGSRLLEMLLRIARDQAYPQPWLNAQNTAVRFYQRHGFLTQGRPFEEAGISHCRMMLAPHKEA